MTTDPLAGLRGFYEPPPPSWMPQTAGWYVTFVVIALLLAWVWWRQYRRWRRNRYRREALRELETIETQAIPELMKRVALAAWPRTAVASLSGDSWIHFVEASGGSADVQPLLLMNYGDARLTGEEEQKARAAAADWIEHHHVHA